MGSCVLLKRMDDALLLYPTSSVNLDFDPTSTLYSISVIPYIKPSLSGERMGTLKIIVMLFPF